MTQYQVTLLHNIADTSLLTLITELEQVTGVKRFIFANSTLGQFIEQCLRPNGSDTPQILIDKRMLDSVDPSNSFFLRKQIKRHHETAAYALFDEIVRTRGDGESIEQVSGKSIYTFINHYFKMPKSKRKKKSINLWKI